MKAIRLVLTQNKAHFCKESSNKNRMTNPLPYPSTIIGAIHNICNWKEYVPLNISIQGKFDGITKEMHNFILFNDSLMDDRNMLVKMCSPDILYGKYQIVSKALKSMGSKHSEELFTEVVNRELLEEYKFLRNNKIILKEQEIKELGDKPIKLHQLKADKKSLKDKKSKEFITLNSKEKELSNEITKIKEKYKNLQDDNTYKLSLFRTVTSVPQYYEVINGLNLIIYIHSEDELILDEILNNIDNLEHLGRTEDSVQIVDTTLIDLNSPMEETFSYNNYVSYIPFDRIRNEDVISNNKSGLDLGTVYFVNKNYQIIDNKRVFKKVKSLLVSKYSIDEESSNVYVDNYNGENVIVCFI